LGSLSRKNCVRPTNGIFNGGRRLVNMGPRKT
jgi:hypothetical protein